MVSVTPSECPINLTPLPRVLQLLDVLGERGFTVTLDVVRITVPERVDAAPEGSSAPIVSRQDKTFVFHITFPKPEIRRNEA